MSVVAGRKTALLNMTEGPIPKQIIQFSLPLMLGNVFQMLYNTVDSIVVGHFVGTEALAAVGSTTMIVNMLVFFFSGFSTGAGVVISFHFGADDRGGLHTAVETAVAASFALCVLFTLIGWFGVEPMLRMMATPDDVFSSSVTYLHIYFAGFSGLMVYNIGSGILRAVGDTRHPLYFLILTSILNIVLDLFFVLGLHAGIAGVAYATILSQFISAVLILYLLTTTKEIYRLSWRDLRIHFPTLRRIFAIGLPAGIQAVLTAISNVFVQAYINFFGSACMAGWGCYNKLDAFVFLPIQSMSMAATTFVSQNIGAGKRERANRGTLVTVGMTLSVSAVIAAILFVFAAPATALFTEDPAVIRFGADFMRWNIWFLLLNGVAQVVAGALRGEGDSKAPMFIMLLCFVAIRQTYLFVVTRYIVNTAIVVGFGYPVGWMTCCIVESLYYFLRHRRLRRTEAA